MAIKKITVSSMEKSVLERIQKEAGFVLPTQAVYDENLDVPTVSSLLQKGWLRETDIGHLVSSAAAPNQSSVVDTSSPAPSSPEPASPSPSIPTTVVLPKVEVSEEDKAKSYENFLKIMANK